ncbi:MAG TPA: flagellar FliJ family protein [Alphaproteobacteria bacterium]|nr:flagellar FliJ family protein [Alphaproteobacteria bacterium]USO04687.1 MAG: flagellar FliJ family protein [Rhodospirillales bacterium]HOO82531.1 flagellar FliJ family protein [Alphaproteobacteria bacterium]
MAKLNGLIRVHKHALDQKQKFVAELYRQAEELENQKTTLLNQLDEEREKIQEFGVEMLSYFGPYSEAVKERVIEINEAATVLESRIEIAREDMRAAFAELKKIQLTQQARENEEEKERNKKESGELDEIAIEGYRRQQRDE